jgi:transmembrane sensor
MTRLDALLRQVADEQDALRAKSNLRERLVVRVQRGSPARRTVRGSWALSLAAAVAALGVVIAIAGGRSALGVRIGESGGTPLLGAWLGASDLKPLALEFTDGSRFEFAPKSKARLIELWRGGARVELASGTVKVHVVPRKAADFRLDAGPFGVHVTGTRFEMRYSPEGDAFELFLEEGQVELTGCVFGRGRKLAAGQSVRASCAKQALDVSYGPLRSERGSDSSAPAPPEIPKVPLLPETTRAAKTEGNEPGGGSMASSAASGKTPGPKWLTLARSGDYDGAFAIVHTQGFEAECERANADALALLADVARHAGAPKQAEHALHALRRRFPGTNDGALAAFALGRLEFDEYRAYPTAATWFKTYLNERPTGPMAREALGRLLEAHYRAQDLAAAREAAARYLREYPSGPHAELASRVISSP